MPRNDWRVQPLAPDYVVVDFSEDPERIFSYSPWVMLCPGGRLVATVGRAAAFGAHLDGEVHETGSGDWHRYWQGRVYTSDDNGRSWTLRTSFPFMHARAFLAGERLYVLGQAGDLMIMASDDHGETWSPPVKLTEGQTWGQAPCAIWYRDGRVYISMTRRTSFEIKGWGLAEGAPVLMRGNVDADLTDVGHWTFASELSFRDLVDDATLDAHGIPFFDAFFPEDRDLAPGRHCPPVGWLESNVVQFTDPDHVWCDPTGRTFHLWSRAHTGLTNYAAIVKVVENDDGTMTTLPERAPSGRRCVFVPCPGGHMKFHIIRDDATGLFWLLSSQATDSMCRIDRLSEDRFALPDNERRRLQLHFSTNCVDWCFAGLVAVGPVERASRHYASMVIVGEDLHILSRSGDERARSAHDGNLITFHTVRNFRDLVY